jgi:hypothetical protein
MILKGLMPGKGCDLGGGLTFPVLRGEIVRRRDDSDCKRQIAYGKKVLVPKRLVCLCGEMLTVKNEH